jgi:hypothetical protein
MSGNAKLGGLSWPRACRLLYLLGSLRDSNFLLIGDGRVLADLLIVGERSIKLLVPEGVPHIAKDNMNAVGRILESLLGQIYVHGHSPDHHGRAGWRGLDRGIIRVYGDSAHWN